MTAESIDREVRSPLLTLANLELELSGKKIAIFLPSITNTAYLRYLLRVIDIACRSNSRVIVLDCNWNTQYVGQNELVFLRATTIRKKFFRILAEIYPNTFSVVEILSHSHEDKILLDEHASIAKELSIKSIFMTMNLRLEDQFDRSTRSGLVYAQLEENFERYYQVAKNFVSENNLILFLNGRWPEQAAIRAYCETNFKDFLSLEHGKPNGERFHLQPFQTQEYSAMRPYFAEIRKGMTQSEISHAISWGEKWLKTQSQDSRLNPHLIPMSRDAIEKHERENLVTIFNSSFDERFSNLGIELNGWQSQEDALLETAKIFHKFGYKSIVRIHPNTINKGWSELMNLVNLLEKSEIPYILPWNRPSTYELLEKSRVVVTWGSTISIESTAREIPTFNLGRTPYDNLIDVNLFTSAHETVITEAELSKPDREKSLIAAFITRNWGFDLSQISMPLNLEALDTEIAEEDFWLREIHKSKLIARVRVYIRRFVIKQGLSEFVKIIRKSRGKYRNVGLGEIYKLLSVIRNERLKNLMMTQIFHCYRRLLSLLSH